jgi:MFS transporter, ACS family, hexuronate transporter
MGMTGRTHYRWVICGLLFFATTINYVDREVLGLLAPRLTKEFAWTERHYSFIVNAFTLAYAVSYTLAGRLMDWIGERKGFALAVALWSVAAMAHGLISPLVYSGMPWLNAALAGTFLGSLTPAILSVAGFSMARFALGAAEGGNFPAAVKAVGTWYPRSERAVANGIFNAGSCMGVIVASFLVWLIVEELDWGWPAAFYLTGALGFVWLVFWWAMYDLPEKHPRVSPAELAHICSDPPDPAGHVPWLSLLKYRQTWAFAAGNFLISPVWWFYLYWTPKFLENNFGVTLKGVFGPLLLVYLVADVGSVAGGGLSSWLIHRGRSTNFARKTAFFICSLGAVPMLFVARLDSIWVAVAFLGLAAAADTGFAANLYAIVPDTVPRKAISSVVGFGGTAGCVGFIVFSTVIGWILDWTKARSPTHQPDYLIPFLIAASAYLIATAVIHLLLPRLEMMSLEPTSPSEHT